LRVAGVIAPEIVIEASDGGRSAAGCIVNAMKARAGLAKLFMVSVTMGLGWSLTAAGCGSTNGEMVSGGAGDSGTGLAGTNGAAGTGSNGAAGTGQAGPPANLGDCDIFPANDDWNTSVASLPADATWTQRLNTLVGATRKVHPDFGDGYGIPINVVPASQAAVPIVFNQYEDESDPGPYPFPGPNAIQIEGGTAANCSGDCHVLVVQTGTCMLYEGYACKYANGWQCGNGAKWDLKKVAYGQRPDGWTSADAAGLPIMPGILRYAEAAAGPVRHAVRFTLSATKDAYVKPATHEAGNSSSPNRPPMGLRVRMKADFTIPNAMPIVENILSGLKNYGMILADNGSNFYFQGDPNPGWNDDILDQIKSIPASAFEVVAPSPLPP
jgi:hypothetical protein